MTAATSMPEQELDALRRRCETYEEILRVVCGHLELPQSESGPADDLRIYDRALEAADLYTRQTDAELAENRRLRFVAEADRERLLQAVGPFTDVASKLPDGRDIAEGSSLWVRREQAFEASRAAISAEVYSKLRNVVIGIAKSRKETKEA